jgi:hypothetical protein
MMLGAFQIFNVWPTYGEATAQIEWKLADETPDGDIYFYRSRDGVKGSWELLNETPASGREGLFIDPNLPQDNPLDFYYYRGMVDVGGTFHKGVAVGALDRLGFKEYNLLRAAIRREYLHMRRGSGVPAWHCIPRSFGTPAAGTDPDTGVKLADGCAGPDMGFGEKYAGGFNPPVATRVWILQMQPRNRVQRPDATGSDAQEDVVLRLMAFPRPAEGHMIVLPESDRRYVIAEPIDRFFFRGIAPMFWECRGQLLDRRDPRHRLPIPGRICD